MTVTSRSAQIEVKDNDSFAGVNIYSTLSGYAAVMTFWGGAAYLCRHKDDARGISIVQLPSEKWLQDFIIEGYVIIGKLSELAESVPPTPNAPNEVAATSVSAESQKEAR